ncbi:MAG: branched-chain-amino-acid transaminase [Candidatus Methylacidiphilales bacterium]|nr:branched-chain-amino-acid transaminase [Candidatus Methylacidiphilales bacterium]
MKIYIDGQFYAKEDAKISVFDHGLLYGDGVFEGIRAYHGRVFRLDEHIDRLFDSAKAILLTIPMDRAAMARVVVDTCRESNIQDGYIRLVVTRGVGDLGLNPNKCPKATVFCIATGISIYPPEVYQKGLKIITASTRRIGPASLSPAIKSLNYLNQVLARIEGNLAGADELIVLNDTGHVAECTADNIFVIKKGRILTPPISAGALGGITRRAVMDLAEKAGTPILEAELTRYDLWVADEIFLTGTAAEVVPVREVDGRTIGDGKPGPVTQRFTAAFHDLTRSTGTPIVG